MKIKSLYAEVRVNGKTFIPHLAYEAVRFRYLLRVLAKVRLSGKMASTSAGVNLSCIPLATDTDSLSSSTYPQSNVYS